jgi:hypothetical protein
MPLLPANCHSALPLPRTVTWQSEGHWERERDSGLRTLRIKEHPMAVSLPRIDLAMSYAISFNYSGNHSSLVSPPMPPQPKASSESCKTRKVCLKNLCLHLQAYVYIHYIYIFPPFLHPCQAHRKLVGLCLIPPQVWKDKVTSIFNSFATTEFRSHLPWGEWAKLTHTGASHV